MGGCGCLGIGTKTGRGVDDGPLGSLSRVEAQLSWGRD